MGADSLRGSVHRLVLRDSSVFEVRLYGYGSCAAERDEAVGAEKTRGDAAIPVGGIEAEGAGKFVAAEAGSDAHVGVVAADVVGSKERGEGGEEDLEDAAAGGFAGDNEAGVDAELGAECGEFGFGELMEDEVADDDGVVGVRRKSGEIGRVPRAGGGPVGGAGPAVEAVEGDGATVESAAEFAGAGAEFEDELGGAEERREGAEKPTKVAHRTVGEA